MSGTYDRAQGSIGVPPVFSIRVQDDDTKACRANFAA